MKKYFTLFSAWLLDFSKSENNFFKIFYPDFAKIVFSNVVIIEGYFLPDFLSVVKGGRSMNPQNHEEHIRHSFDSYCKRILKRKVLDIHREIKRRSAREIAFSDMSARELASIAVSDEYFANEFAFDILGESIGVSNFLLAEALSEISENRREIVLMSYFFDMSDREIAEHLNMARRTVAYQRTSTLRELKKILESEE
jgi:RNA polymerase sigma factor (sigma-70 family)